MKKILYAIGLVIPGIATKALAQQMKLPDIQVPEGLRGQSILETTLSSKESHMLDMYERCSYRERAVFLFKVLTTSEDLDNSILNPIIRQNKIDQVLRLPEIDQKEQILEMIRKGGMRWGSIGDPSDNTGTY